MCPWIQASCKGVIEVFGREVCGKWGFGRQGMGTKATLGQQEWCCWGIHQYSQNQQETLQRKTGQRKKEAEKNEIESEVIANSAASECVRLVKVWYSMFLNQNHSTNFLHSKWKIIQVCFVSEQCWFIQTCLSQIQSSKSLYYPFEQHSILCREV